MAESYLERSYLNLDSESEPSLFTRNSRVRRSQWDERGSGSSRKARTVIAPDIGGDGLRARIRERLSDIPQFKIYIAIAIVVILVLGAIGGGIAAGIVSRRNNSRNTASNLNSTPASLFNTSVQASTSTVPGNQQSLYSESSFVPDTKSTTSTQVSFSKLSTLKPTITKVGLTTPYVPTTNTLFSTTSTRSTYSTTSFTPICTSTPVLVTFRDIVKTVAGETVKVVGNTTALGNWNPELAPTLYEQILGEVSWWSTSLFLMAGQVVIYEFVISEANGSYIWKPDCVFTTTVSGACTPTATPTTSVHQTFIPTMFTLTSG